MDAATIERESGVSGHTPERKLGRRGVASSTGAGTTGTVTNVDVHRAAEPPIRPPGRPRRHRFQA